MAWSDKVTDVAHLKSDNFDEFMSANPSVLVMFYAPCMFANTLVFLLFYYATSTLINPKTVVSTDISKLYL